MCCTIRMPVIFSGSVSVLYTDYEYALVLECFDESPDGSCVQGQSTLLLYGRSTTSVLPNDTKTKIGVILMKSSLNISLLEHVSHESKWLKFRLAV